MKIFCDLRVFVLSPKPRNENSEIAEILQKRHGTKISESLECWNATQMTSNSKRFIDITNLVTGSCFLELLTPSRFIKFSLLLSISVFTFK